MRGEATSRPAGQAVGRGGDRPAQEVELSIIMPCLNEAETIATCIAKAQGFLTASGVGGEVVVGDNGSTDGSQALAEGLGARVVPVAERGYGAALRGAIAAAQGRFLIMGDSDDSYDFSRLHPFLDGLRRGYDLVMGNRFQGGIAPGAMPWKNRYIGNPILTGIGRVFFGSACGDFHCGLRGFSREAYERMSLQTKGMEFASEMVIKATLARMKVLEVPTTLSPDGRSRGPHLRPWSDGWRHLRFMLLYSPRWLFLIPGLCLFLVSLLATLRLFWGPVNLFGMGFDVSAMVFTAGGMLIGMQSIFFAFSTKVYAIQHGLLPPDRKFEGIFRYFNLEIGLVLCGLCLLIGCAGFVYAVLSWKAANFTIADLRSSLRVILISALSLAMGVQGIFFSFFMSVLGLNLKGDCWPRHEDR